MSPLLNYKRIILKIGSALLVDGENGTLDLPWLLSLCEDIAWLHKKGVEIVVVSSGAIALGRTTMNLPLRALKLEESQAAASIGQILLSRAWQEGLNHYNIGVGQVLLTWHDTEDRRRYINAKHTIDTLLKYKSIPLINENDAVATEEIRYGDNDRLAARIGTMVSSDLVILLSDVDGLYSERPSQNPNAEHFPLIENITPEIEAMAKGAASYLSRGGMATKVSAAKMAVQGGSALIIASGLTKNPLSKLGNEARYTLFSATESPESARKIWIKNHIDMRGKIFIDNGAVTALRSGRSLLSAGVRKIEGEFERGDPVEIFTINNEKIAIGLAGYDFEDSNKIIGKRTSDIQTILSYPPRSAFIHRNDLALL